jgi:hypothetical protein
MAENKQNPGAVDQSKVKAEAEALAKPGAQPKPITTDSPSEQAANLATGPVRGPEKVENISPEDAERRLEDQRAKEFGPGYVRAYKTTGEGGQGRQETTFSARAWDLLGNNKEGWKPLVKEPPEVAKLKGDKADSEAAK